MYKKWHDEFQHFLDEVIESNIALSTKKDKIKTHLLIYQERYEQMLLAFFENETLTNDTYFYITYTYHDLPIDLSKKEEMVVSILYDIDHGIHFEMVIFNTTDGEFETKEIFSRLTDFYS